MSGVSGERSAETDASGIDRAAADGELKIAAKEAADLIRAQSNGALLQLLKKPEFAESSGRVFTGYRVSAENLKLPLARGRLISEVVTNAELLDGLLALPSPQDGSVKPPGQKFVPHKAAPQAPIGDGRPERSGDTGSDQALTAERDALRREARALRSAVQAASEAEAEARRELRAAREQINSLRTRVAAEEAGILARERRLRRFERELSDAHAVAHAGKSRRDAQKTERQGPPSPSAFPAGSGSDRPVSSLFAALERLISRGKTEPARLLAEEILRGDQANVDALRMRAAVRQAQGDRPSALMDLRAIFEAHAARHESLHAARAMLRWITLADTSDRKMAQTLYALLAREGAAVVSEARDILGEVRGGPSERYEQLRSWCQPALAGALFSGAGDAESTGLALPPQFLQLLARVAPQSSVTAKALVGAITCMNSALVDAARDAFAKLDKRAQALMLAGIAEAADGDDVYGRLLSRRIVLGPAVIDASNVAHYERQLMPSMRPLLASVLAVRRAVWNRGHFPAALVADANLPHVIDAPDALWAMARSGELELVTGGTVADEQIVREARRLGGVIVSNDYMADWDPLGEVPKLQYSISMTDGRATLYE